VTVVTVTRYKLQPCRVAQKVGHYQMIKNIVLNRIKACQWD